MSKEIPYSRVEQLLSAIGGLIPHYMQDPLDRTISNGNVAVCIIDDAGTVCGKMYGEDKARRRQTFRTAWTKASQVWLTGMKTGEYEKKVFNGEIEDGAHGISMPDLVGWTGGQPVVLKDGTRLAIGFSGFRGISDLEIVTKAVAQIDAG